MTHEFANIRSHFSNKRAYLVGISDYTFAKKLNTPVKDVKAISEGRDRGGDIYYSVCTLDGKITYDFKDDDEYMQFRSSAMVHSG